MTHIKSADTKTPASQSRVDLERMLRRYGASAFATSSDYEKGSITVTFRVPDRPGEKATVPVRLEVNFKTMMAALFGDPKTFWDARGRGWVTEYRPEQVARAERVAWRQLLLWVDAACSAAAAGFQTMREAFFAHTLIRDETGKVGRLVDYIATMEQGGQLALPPGDS